MAGAVAAEADPAFEVLDVFEGLFRLETRNPTLDGSVPLRVAQGCAPLLAGNAYGHQLTLSRLLPIGERLGRVRLGAPDDLARDLRRLSDAALPRLLAHGLLERDGPWHRALARGVVSASGRRRLALFTGLLVRPAAGLVLRVTAAANRRNTRIDVEEQLLGDRNERLVPLLLTIDFPRGATPPVTLAGEIACLAPLRPGATVTRRPLREAPAAGRAHADFYDAAYFAAKKDGVTGKYRRLVAQEPGGASADARVELVEAGPVDAAIGTLDRATGAAGPVPVERPGGPVAITFRNAVRFSALFDGHTLAIEPDRAALARIAGEIERTWDAALGAGYVEAHRGALWYLTKYFTPHTPGEPHFFVKPAALTVTPPGWSCLVDGLHGDGYDVLRGVVSTDTFHATPAVFRLFREGEPIRVAAGAPLLRVIPLPRSLLSTTWRAVALDDAR